MRRLSWVWVFVAAVCAGCGSTVTQPDLAIIPTGCRMPSKCYLPTCSCKRGSLDDPNDCLSCDPSVFSTQQCPTCGGGDGTVCVEPNQLCVGRGPICPGVGATCLPAGADGGTGDPPTLVAVDTGDSGADPTSVPRCAYADDVCVPGDTDGGLDLSVPDLGSPPDLLATD